MATPSLPALEAFVAVARHGSFRQAAAARGVTPSALSHIIRGLEASLDMRLFNRTNRSVHITEAGELLLQRAGPALAEIAEVLQHLGSARGRPSGALRLNVPRTAAELVLRPVLERFLSAYPEVTLEIVGDDGLVDIVAGGFHAGIRPGRLLAQDMIAVAVGPPRRFAVVGAPAYFAHRAKPRTPQELHAHDCIGRRYPSGTRYAWELTRGEEHVDVAVTGRLVVDDSGSMVQAAIDGAGLAFVYEGLVAEAVVRGDLVRVLEDWCPVLPPFSLYYPGRRQLSPALRALIDMIKA